MKKRFDPEEFAELLAKADATVGRIEAILCRRDASERSITREEWMSLINQAFLEHREWELFGSKRKYRDYKRRKREERGTRICEKEGGIVDEKEAIHAKDKTIQFGDWVAVDHEPTVQEIEAITTGLAYKMLPSLLKDGADVIVQNRPDFPSEWTVAVKFLVCK